MHVVNPDRVLRHVPVCSLRAASGSSNLLKNQNQEQCGRHGYGRTPHAHDHDRGWRETLLWTPPLGRGGAFSCSFLRGEECSHVRVRCVCVCAAVTPLSVELEEVETSRSGAVGASDTHSVARSS